MKIKKGFVIREVSGQIMVIATEEASLNFHGLIRLNQTGKFIWEAIERGLSIDEIALELSQAYKINLDVAKADTKLFIKKMQEEGFFDEE